MLNFVAISKIAWRIVFLTKIRTIFWNPGWLFTVFLKLRWNCYSLKMKPRVECKFAIQIHVFSTRFYGLFYWKNEVSVETTFIFILWCGIVSRENWMKLAGFFFVFFGAKMKLAVVSWVKLAKIVKPSRFVREKNWN